MAVHIGFDKKAPTQETVALKPSRVSNSSWSWSLKMARVLEDASCFGAQHCQSLYTVRYCETCSNCM
ncbi:hypothetical protein SeMB42_g05623 [Synchytrium endobioticum]|uniref:Uncharacterized protein n=1 Tax=Synchytrium endobioticum TaxID=286115 RepID=A0A507CQ90_9FUNG|nr:hypothetical protein SeMB42_g05623 [Synchytrium endobioticum]